MTGLQQGARVLRPQVLDESAALLRHRSAESIEDFIRCLEVALGQARRPKQAPAQQEDEVVLSPFAATWTPPASPMSALRVPRPAKPPSVRFASRAEVVFCEVPPDPPAPSKHMGRARTSLATERTTPTATDILEEDRDICEDTAENRRCLAADDVGVLSSSIIQDQSGLRQSTGVLMPQAKPCLS